MPGRQWMRNTGNGNMLQYCSIVTSPYTAYKRWRHEFCSCLVYICRPPPHPEMPLSLFLLVLHHQRLGYHRHRVYREGLCTPQHMTRGHRTCLETSACSTDSARRLPSARAATSPWSWLTSAFSRSHRASACASMSSSCSDSTLDTWMTLHQGQVDQVQSLPCRVLSHAPCTLAFLSLRAGRMVGDHGEITQPDHHMSYPQPLLQLVYQLCQLLLLSCPWLPC